MESIALKERFVVLRQLGAGGFSKVFKVEDKAKNNKKFALKILFLDITKDNAKESILDFEKEVEFLKKLKHDSIVRIVEELYIDNHPAILMELVEGISLQDLILKRKVLNTQEVLDIAHHISAALLACHTFQIPREKLGLHTDTVLLNNYAIIHNDISAKNIIKEDKGDSSNYKLIDFGLSYVPNEILSGENMSKGTLEYYPPEKWNGEKVNTSSDIYSFGIVLYQMLAGQVPFSIQNYRDANQIEMAKKHHLESNLPDLWEKRKEKLLSLGQLKSEEPDYPYWFQLLIERCLAKNPKDRFRTGEYLNRYFQDGIRGRLKNEWPNQIDFDEEDDWLKAYETNTIESYEQFKIKYPNSKHIAQSNEEIDYLKEIERLRKLEEIDWRKCLELHTLTGYKNYISNYPKGKYIHNANENINLLEIEEKDWIETKEWNNIKNYKKFIEKYPNSQFVTKAKDNISILESNKQSWAFLPKLNNKVLIIVLTLLLFVIGFYFINNFRKQKTEFITAENTNHEQESYDILLKYYESKYVNNDFDKIINELISYPVIYNGNAYEKDNFERIIKSRSNITTALRNTDSYTIRDKKIVIDSIKFDSISASTEAFVTYSFIKKENKNRPVKRSKKIHEAFDIDNGKIKMITKK